ncbi:hypothetical protein ACFQ6U_14135 [Streptomyces sp. NPDC056465]|uniref:hypothetical protein n=1 Tax=unclassified Streptomyces TaxID=2593676 RepID=UPI0035D8EF9D
MNTNVDLPWNTRVRRLSDGRFGTVSEHDAELRILIKWDRASFVERHPYTPEELFGPDFLVFPAVTHCSECGHIVGDGGEDDVEDGYTTCCNEPACGPCAPVDGIFTCGIQDPTHNAA